MVKVAINGLGRIGRLVLKCLLDKEVEIVAANAPRHLDSITHLLKYDSVHTHSSVDYSLEGDLLRVADQEIRIVSEREPEKLPWKDLEVDLVVEATGKFRDMDSNSKHLSAGAKKVVLTVPGKGVDATIVLGVNEEIYEPEKHHIVSNASCTTNCLAPMAKVLDESFGLKKGFMTTIHAYTGDQRILDGSHKDLRRARAAAMSMIPTTTGAARSVGLVLPHLKGRLDGLSVRVPTPNVSLVDLVIESERPTDRESVNQSFKEAAEGKLKGILGYSDQPLVSVDYNGESRSGVIDALSTNVLGDNLVKVLGWYDNEWGYSCRVADLVELMAKKGIR